MEYGKKPAIPNTRHSEMAKEREGKERKKGKVENTSEAKEERRPIAD